MLDSELHNIIVNRYCSLAEAINRLESYPSQVILVCDSYGRLLGTITDGDIRRAVLSHETLETPVHTIMNASPRYVTKNCTKGDISNLMKREAISQVPIIDDKNRVVGLETLRTLFDEQAAYSCPVMIMAGGFGKRLRPYTNDLPKPMVKIAGKPILERIIDKLRKQGFSKLIITTHYLSSKIRSYFGNGEAFDVEITYLVEDTPLGTAGSIALVPQQFREQPILITNGDVLTDIDYRQLLSFHQAAENAQMTVCVRSHEYKIPFGVMDFKDGRVNDIIEKPVKRDFINAGIYVINPAIHNYIEKSEVIDMPDLVRRLIKNKEKISVFPIIKYWKDVGTLTEFSEAEMLLQEEV